MSTTPRIPAAVLLAATFFFPYFSQAMEIHKFDKMAIQDQGDYIQALVDGAQKVLIDQDQRDVAAKIYQLFNNTLPGDKISLGMTEFERNLARARLADVKRAAQDPNASRLEVEDAMAVTLKKNGIELPPSFFTIAKDFKPKHSPEEKKN